MVLRLEGEIRRRMRSGLPPFAKLKWRSEAFAIDVPTSGERIDVAEDLFFQCVPSPAGWVLQGKVSNVSCMFGEVRRDEIGKGFSFTMLSVSNREVSGRVSVVQRRYPGAEEAPPPSSPKTPSNRQSLG